jgi:hypothetical protein
MNRMTIRSRVDADGILRVNVPVGAAEGNREVEVTIEPLEPAQMTQAQWAEFIQATAGSITDPTFVRDDQGEYEQREEWR